VKGSGCFRIKFIDTEPFRSFLRHGTGLTKSVMLVTNFRSQPKTCFLARGDAKKLKALFPS